LLDGVFAVHSINSPETSSISGVFLRTSEVRRLGGAEPGSRVRGQHANGRSRTEFRGVSWEKWASARIMRVWLLFGNELPPLHRLKEALLVLVNMEGPVLLEMLW